MSRKLIQSRSEGIGGIFISRMPSIWFTSNWMATAVFPIFDRWSSSSDAEWFVPPGCVGLFFDLDLFDLAFRYRRNQREGGHRRCRHVLFFSDELRKRDSSVWGNGDLLVSVGAEEGVPVWVSSGVVACFRCHRSFAVMVNWSFPLKIVFIENQRPCSSSHGLKMSRKTDGRTNKALSFKQKKRYLYFR